MRAVLGAEIALRLGAFLGIFAGMAFWEMRAPRRVLREPKGARWRANLSLLAVDTAMLRLLFPAAAVGAAILARERGWGLLALMELPAWASVPLSVAILDLAVYFQHVVFHAVPAFWRVHRVHHADLDFDLTTGFRFHPIEIVLSMLFKIAVVVSLGPPVAGVVLFEVLLNATSMFNHGNVRLPAAADLALRTVLVTPDMHRVHHSALRHETNSNFGFCLSWWDQVLGTYRAQPSAGHDGMTVGLDEFQDVSGQSLAWLLRLPALGASGEVPIGARDSAR